MITLVIGGSGSGKSDYAESLLKDSDKKIYLATMPYNTANKTRIGRHIRLRADKGFITIERTNDFLGMEIPDGYDILLEDLPNLLANEMFKTDGTVNEKAYKSVTADIDFIMSRTDNLIIVSDDIFLSGMEYDPLTEKYMRILGQLHSWIAKIGRLKEVAAGIVIQEK